jgi:hypothetical protein
MECLTNGYWMDRLRMELLRRKMKIMSAIEGEAFFCMTKVNYVAKDYETAPNDN